MADDESLLRHLNAVPPEAWEQLFALVDDMRDSDWEVTAGGGTLTASGTSTMPYPVYSPKLTSILDFFTRYLTAPFAWTEWLETHGHLLEAESISSAEPPDIIRIATALIRSERFSEGTIASSISSGLLQAILERLRRWHVTGK